MSRRRVADRRRRHPRDDRRVPARAGGRRRSRSSSARPTSAGSSAPSTSTATPSTASTTSSCRRDDRVLGLAEELGLGDRFRFRPTKVGFYDDGRLFSMTSPKEFLTFPLLRPRDRIRLAAFVARCQLQVDVRRTSTTSRWWTGCERRCGRRRRRTPLEAAARLEVRRPLRRPPGDLHLGAHAPDVERRATSPGREVMGWLEGGYQTLIDALEQRDPRARRRGARGHRGRADRRRPGRRCDRARGRGRFRPFDFVLCTLAPPMARPLLAPELLEHAPADHCRYLGVVCLLLRAAGASARTTT